MKFKANGINYQVDMFGAVHQLDIEPYVYDAKYSSTYDTPEYKHQSEVLQALRISFAIASHGRPINSLLDIGYGNGAFMNFAKRTVKLVGGKDITGVSVPEGCFQTDKYEPVDVITFWDCLEHIPDLMFVRDLPAETIVISLPFCHLKDRGIEWFESEYHHLKKNEHLHHFDKDSLISFMDNMGWCLKSISNLEDIVRQRDPEWNILTASFKRKEEVWLDIKGWEGKYQISSFGRVKSLERRIGWGKGYIQSERILRDCNTPDGYKSVSLTTQNRKYISARIHKLVCHAFHPNFDNKPTVNHKNGVRWHNYATNVEWSTMSENVQHGFDYNNRKIENLSTRKAIRQLNTEGQLIKIWPSMLQMEKEGGYKRHAISLAIKHNKPYYGHKWEYDFSTNGEEHV